MTVLAVVGLGNPGPGYAATRHNAGAWFVQALARELGVSLRQERRLDGALATHGAGDARRFLFQPGSFMNESGRPVRAFVDYFRIPVPAVLVAYDDLDLAPGIARLKRGGGHGGHNGLRDLHRHLPSTDFPRLRLGIGHPGQKERVTGHVLGRPSAEDAAAIEGAIERALEVVPLLFDAQWDRAVHALHSAGA